MALDGRKKKAIGWLALIAAIAIIVLVVWFAKLPKNSSTLLQDGFVLPEAKCHNINKVAVIYGAGCPHCAVALPRLRQLEQELNMSFTYYDLAIGKDKETILSLGLIPEGVPTAIINCKVYVGVRDKEEYKQAILG